MGAGKTSIALLIDYCLGADIELTPALQSEFVSAALAIQLEGVSIVVERPRDSGQVIASWNDGSAILQVILPAREPQGIVIPGTPVENLSDLLFWLSGFTPPRVRQSKIKDETALGRVSVRDLLWFCYLDQASMDSSFFHLDADSNPWKRLKSRNVIRFVIGFHEERVAALEAILDALRVQKLELTVSIAGLRRALQEVGVGSGEELLAKIAELQSKVNGLSAELVTLRENSAGQTTHSTDVLREQARGLSARLAGLDDALHDIEVSIDADERHLHEIETLVLKFKRSISAKAVLSGVTFEVCPRCAKQLPERGAQLCRVCGQDDAIDQPDPTELAIIEKDAKARESELKDVLKRYHEKHHALRHEREEVIITKARIERERNSRWLAYDTAYLSNALTKEREHASLLQEIEGLKALTKLPQLLDVQYREIERIAAEEARSRAELKAAREAAERDSDGLDRLKVLFLDCLLRSHVPGIRPTDTVEISSADFLPEVYGPDALEATVTSFSNMSSGGKKSLFKCCFAIALHRVAIEKGAILPKLLMIDSPMKNISERENLDQFESFHRLLYELKGDELQSTQMILIDKEYCPPPSPIDLRVSARHMRPDDEEHKPLIPYYRGH
jgi:hypothetical protein